jgi:hypothetical protein
MQAHLLEEGGMGTLETGSHATSSIPSLGNVPSPVNHGVVHKSVEWRRELEAKVYPEPSASALDFHIERSSDTTHQAETR